MKDICQLLGSRRPIIQGAMGVISNPEMVAERSKEKKTIRGGKK
jgi:NAD(P)H-dependent flavin oxidoreductase YrpB (nitropropane dioxygenase family)